MWLTALLILLPVGAGLLVWLAPLDRFWTSAVALVASLAELAFWIDGVTGFDFEKPGLQYEERHGWFRDLGVSWHVGFYGFSLWLVGLTVVAAVAATVYAAWAGRERPRAYFGLLLFLTGAIVG